MTSPTPAPAADVAARRVLVDRAREGWIRRLIDLSRRNNLLYYRDLKSGTLDLAGHDPARMLEVLAGQSVVLPRLVPFATEEELKVAWRRLDQVRRRAIANIEEKGLDTLFMAVGMATWPATDDGRPAAAAVLLVPVAIEARGREGALYLKRRGEAQVNPVLLHVLRFQHGVGVAAEAVLGALGGGAEDEAFDPQPAFEGLKKAAATIVGFEVTPRWVVGNFAFQKMAMVRDLQDHGDVLAGHDLISAIAGDDGARQAALAGRVEIPLATLDETPPEAEFMVVDADSSQARVVRAALSHQDGVIQGPPGTGKSQTIVNLIASMAAEGKRVLFVAEKRAALEVVLRRLQTNGLGHLALDLHGADVSRRQVMQRVAESLRAVREALPVPAQDVHEPFSDRRRRLIGNRDRVHLPHAPSGLSLYELHGRILRSPPGLAAITRWRGHDLARITADTAVAIRDLLVEAGGFGGLFLRDDASPWTGARLADGATVAAASDAVGRLVLGSWTPYRAAVDALVGQAGFAAPGTVAEANALVRLATETNRFLERYDAAIFDRDLAGDASDLYPATRGWLPRTLAGLVNGAYRSAKGATERYRRGNASPRQVLAEVEQAADLAKRWAAASGGAKPVECEAADDAAAAYEAARVDLEMLAGVFAERGSTAPAFAEFESTLRVLAADTATPPRLPRLAQIEDALTAAGAASFVVELRSQKPAAGAFRDLFDLAYWWSCLEEARMGDAGIAGFNGRTHDQFVGEFAALDRERLLVARDRVRRAHAERVIDVMNANPEQEALVRREAEKKTRHLPLRRLLAQAPDLLTTLCPCWMASPLSVSQLLDGSRRYFDVVVFDEASQVLPEDAVPALMRGDNAVVAGDQHQLPPTIFFAAGKDEFDPGADGQEDMTGGFESLLDQMAAFLEPWSLDWHYRSRDERLIAFSNSEIYDGRLITFPSAGEGRCLGHVLVDSAGEDQQMSVAEEVARVVELVLAHAEQRPGETLGVIAMGIEHARRVEEAIQSALQLRADLDKFFDQSLDERFFVKNLERVQGDERDAIILTVGYGRNRAGSLLNNFGPLNQDGGHRRLNVAITRARRRMTVVSSFTHHEMDPARFRARGVTLLRSYLQYAASGGAGSGDDEAAAAPGSAFEADVAEGLRERGLGVVARWGSSRYRIDLVVRHPTDEGRFVMAIECDGATYRELPTTRDRDRTRRQVLEGLGWKFHRIWSTDWFLRREEEIERAVAAFNAAVAAADGTAPAPSRAPAVARRVTEEDLAEVPGRSPRPRGIGHRKSIDDYGLAELVALVRWVQSDGRLRSDDELVAEMVVALGFKRRGPKIVAAIRAAIERGR